jgi:hypothetical protein
VSFLGRDGLQRILDHPIAFHPCLVDVSGSVNAGIMLSQAVYGSKRSSESDGSFWKQQKDWYEETRLSRWEQEGARKLLRKRSFWSERYDRLRHRQYYRVDFDALEEVLLFEGREPTFPKEEKPHSGKRKNHLRDGGRPAVGNEEKPPSRELESLRRDGGKTSVVRGTETTSEITSETSSSSSSTPPRSETPPTTNAYAPALLVETLAKLEIPAELWMEPTIWANNYRMFYQYGTGDPGPARPIPFEPDATQTLWKRCRLVKPDCTPEEILAIVYAKIGAHARRSKPIENWQGFLIVAVPRSFGPG